MRSIKRSDAHEDIVRLLAESAHPSSGKSIFPTMRELLCFAATLGFECERRKPLEGKTQEIDGRIFNNYAQALDLLYLIGLADDRNVDILREENEERLITTFEEYANGGLEIIRSWLREKPDDANGDRALLAALAKYKFLEPEAVAEDVVREVTF